MWEWERKKDVLPKPVNCQFALILMAVEDFDPQSTHRCQLFELKCVVWQ